MEPGGGVGSTGASVITGAPGPRCPAVPKPSAGPSRQTVSLSRICSEKPKSATSWSCPLTSYNIQKETQSLPCLQASGRWPLPQPAASSPPSRLRVTTASATPAPVCTRAVPLRGALFLRRLALSL
ncbi:unnamed protein product [Rangifer tarandus platyrhynchus]|uniref:Uncharacterized protein n=1 Tax=Rangifer tarandus platyrhynchus TaxID=3082113 RepID=A0AC60A2J6_RANTA